MKQRPWSMTLDTTHAVPHARPQSVVVRVRCSAIASRVPAKSCRNPAGSATGSVAAFGYGRGMSKRGRASTYKVGVSLGRAHWLDLGAPHSDLASVFSWVMMVENEPLICATDLSNGNQQILKRPQALSGIPSEKIIAYLRALFEEQAARAKSAPDIYGDVRVYEYNFGARSADEMRAAIAAME